MVSISVYNWPSILHTNIPHFQYDKNFTSIGVYFFPTRKYKFEVGQKEFTINKTH